jgi:phosphotransferase system HPr (HPr) family protein
MVEQEVTLTNETGLHARPASLFVQTAEDFSSQIKVIRGEEEVNAKSIMGIMSLGVEQKTKFTIRAEGEDEEKAVSTLVDLVENEFGE